MNSDISEYKSMGHLTALWKRWWNKMPKCGKMFSNWQFYLFSLFHCIRLCPCLCYLWLNCLSGHKVGLFVPSQLTGGCEDAWGCTCVNVWANTYVCTYVCKCMHILYIYIYICSNQDYDHLGHLHTSKDYTGNSLQEQAFWNSRRGSSWCQRRRIIMR